MLIYAEKSLDLNAKQLMFAGNKSLAPDVQELDTPIQFSFHVSTRTNQEYFVVDQTLSRVERS